MPQKFSAFRRVKGKAAQSEKHGKDDKDKQATANKQRLQAFTKPKWELPTRSTLKALVSGRSLRPRDFRTKMCVGIGTFSRINQVVLIPVDQQDHHHHDAPPPEQHGFAVFHEAKVEVKLEEGPPLALKVMGKMTLLETSQIEHVKNEKNILMQCDCPFIVTFLGSFHDERKVYILMEYLHGGELFRRLQREGRLPIDHVKFYVGELLLALMYLNCKQIAYRDLRPENVLFTRDGHLKLCDFGFAKQLSVGGTTTSIVGTPEYLAPEVVRSLGHGIPVDMWALGIICFEMLAGYPPFWDTNPYSIYQKILNEHAPYPRHFDVKARHLLSNLLLHDASHRYQGKDVMKHSWMDRVDWQKLADTELQPPWRPRVEDITDTGNYEMCPDEPPGFTHPVVPSRKRHLFDEMF